MSARYEELAQKARDLLPILRRQARRPYFVELAGTPKAGKTTTLHALRGFLKQCGFHVHEMRERAADCPIAMKGHFFFNTWTTTTMLASMIESLESEADIVLLDRGVFDAIVWLESQYREQQVTSEEYKVFREFVLLDRWRTLTDLTFVFTVSPDQALERENKDLLIPRTGSIMDKSFLERYNSILSDVMNSEQNKFAFFKIDTTNHSSPKDTTYELATELVERIEKWADPDIAVLPRSIVEQIFINRQILPLPDAVNEVTMAAQRRKRSTLVEGGEFVGLVGAAILQHKDQMLLLDRREEQDPKRKIFGRHVLWKGCHIACADNENLSDLLATIATALKSRLKEDFHLAQLDSELSPSFLVWTNDDSADALHLGIFFNLNIRADAVAQALAGKVFKKERDRTKLAGEPFVSPQDLLSRQTDGKIQLESWSRIVLTQFTKES